jgi:hypothetical protein
MGNGLAVPELNCGRHPRSALPQPPAEVQQAFQLHKHTHVSAWVGGAQQVERWLAILLGHRGSASRWETVSRCLSLIAVAIPVPLCPSHPPKKTSRHASVMTGFASGRS